MSKRHLFDEVVVKYDRRRPKYVPSLFVDVIDYADLTEAKSVLEVGCGTGLATEPFLKTGCEVVAIELGKNLAAYTEEKFKDYANLQVIQCAFEDYANKTEFDMLYSATAFHWIPPEIGYKKAFELLKGGGTLALFWNRPSANDSPLHHKLQLLYKEFVPEWNQRQADNGYNPYAITQERMINGGFVDLEVKQYHDRRDLTAEEYVELLDTYSDHRALPESTRIPFYRSIQQTIEDAGNQITIFDTIDLYLGRKPRYGGRTR